MVTEPWVSSCPINAEELQKSGREQQPYVFTILISDINIILLEASGPSMSRLPKQQLTTSLTFPGSLALYISIGLSLVNRF